MSDVTKRIEELSPEKRELLLRKLQAKREGSPVVQGIPKRKDMNAFPLSYSQKQLWFLNQLDRESSFYNISAALRLTGKLNIAALEQSLGQIISRHEVLRAKIITQNGEPVQTIEPPYELHLTVTDLKNQDTAAREELVRKLAKEEAHRPFNLAKDRLIRASLLRTSDSEHVLLLTMHHIVADGWSIGVLIREIALLYEALIRGLASPLPKLSIQYADYAHWQLCWLQGEVLEKQLSHWRQQLSPLPPLLELPIDKPRPAIQAFKGSHQSFALGNDLSSMLYALGREEKATLFMTLLTAFAALVSRYSGQEDFCLGTPIANRERAEIQELIGYFVNTLTMRFDFSGDPTFRQMLKRTREVALQAFAHQDLPFEMLVDDLHPDRNVSYSPVFQVMFGLQGRPIDDLSLADLQINLIEIENETAKFDLLLMMEGDESNLRGNFEYNTDLFEAPTIVRLISHFKTLLQEIAANPDKSIAALSLLTEAEQHLIISEWNDTATAYPKNSTIQRLFEVQVERGPDAIAVVYGDEKLTYAELNRKANQLAHHLTGLGIGPDVLVGMYLERCPAMIVGMLGILKAGGAYLPLDTNYPQERLSFMLADGHVPVLLTQDHLMAKLPENDAVVLRLDADWQIIAKQKKTNPVNRATADNLAYVIYTSGSTGIPKGVSIPQRAIARLVFHTNYIELRPEDRMAQVSNASFDAATFEIWGTLLHGARLVGITKDVALSTKEFATQLREQKITAIFLTTALFNLLASEAPQVFSTLDHVLFGGEAVDPRWVREVLRNGPPKRLLHVYGPTESTTFATWHLVKNVAESAKTVPIGKALSNTQTYVVDRKFRPVPVGIPGELLLGGDGLARDYLNRPDLTAEKYIPNPCSGAAGARLYRTGDLVRLLPDGNIEFIGRIDNQVKIRGFRIEPDEVKAVIARHPDISDAAVLVREDKPGERRLVAYVIFSPDSRQSIDELRAYLKEKMPDYMLPSAFVTMHEFPITPNGKLDRTRMPAPEDSATAGEKGFVAPRTPLERFFAEHWKKILNVEQVGIHDNFFEHGGDSLKAAVLINRLQEQVGEVAPVSAIFLAPTIAELAMYVNAYYPDLVVKYFGTESSDQSKFKEKVFSENQVGHITSNKIAQIREIIKPLAPRKTREKQKNPPAVFVISPPRSGSTLFRVMLAGHPKLFAPPELELLSFNTLEDRKQELSQQFAIWLEATVRAVMEAKNCDAETAKALMEDYEKRNMTIKQFYGTLQGWIGDRLLVDKTPSYPLDLNILQRAEEDFENPLYIHLTRHPYATIYSFIEARLDENFFRYQHPFSRRELGELIWLICHQNIVEFLKNVPPQRQMRLQFEQVLKEPADSMRDVCQFLDIEYDPKMLEPYKGKRMTDGLTPKSQMVGDFKFYLHKNIDTKSVDRWKNFHSDDFLSEISWSTASMLDYQREERPVGGAPSERDGLHLRKKMTSIRRIPRDGDLPLSFAQMRLWFLDQMDPGSALYNIPTAVRLQGDLNVAAIEEALNEIIARHEVLRTTFSSTDGVARQQIAPSLQLNVTLIPLDHLPETEAVEEAKRIADIEGKSPFDLTKGPLIRAKLLKVGHQDYVLVLTLHHIISDGWSVGTLIREIVAFYNAYSGGQKSPLPPLAIQYVDFANWQNEWLQRDLMLEQLSYWKQKLSGSTTALNLPIDHPRPAVLANRGARLPFFILGESFYKLRDLSLKTGATPFTAALTAFAILLNRYTGEEDINIGTPIANRVRSEIEPLIGFFVNTIVLRADLSGNPTFRELLKRMHDVSQEALDYQDLPFEKLVDALQPERDMSRTPLFQVMFAYQKSLMNEAKLPGLTIKPMDVQSRTAKFDLTLEIMERSDGLRGTFEYNADLFDAPTIERMQQHFQKLLLSIVDDPDQPIRSLSYMTQEEKQKLLLTWNKDRQPLPEKATIQELFEAQAIRTPQAVAVSFAGQELTYAELNGRANQLANHLIKQGVGPEVLVGISAERSLELIVGLLGILKAGGAYVPLDPSYPAERLDFILADAGLSHVLTQKRLSSVFQNSKCRAILLDADWSHIARENQSTPASGATGENLAYLIYTSGSTGKPKGAMIQHRNAINLWAGLNGAIYSNHSSGPLRVGLNAPLMFDASVQQIVTLLNGHTLYVLPQEVRGDGAAMVDFIRQHKLEVVDCVPSQLKLMLSAGLLENGQWIPTIMLPGGEAIDESTWRILAQNGRCDFYNMYGPTECTVDSTICRVTTLPDKPSIGKPIVNVQHYILDKDFSPVAIGVAGELYIGGFGLARGYLNLPDLTAERFVPDPFGSDPGGRLYRTGDLVRYLPDGHIEFLGRLDNQIKIRGFRIELGEIEAALQQHSQVQQAVVIAREDVPGNKRLVAYCVPKGQPYPSTSELREHLQAQLPDYMIPSLFVMLEALPMTPNRKVDRMALPKPDHLRPDLKTEYQAPRTPVEKALADIWLAILGVSQVGVYDNFFELGGDSILSIQAIAKANQAGIRLTPKQLFQYPTIEGLAAVAATAPVVQAEQGIVTGSVPLTPIQHWFFEQNLPEPQRWNQAVMLETKMPLDKTALEKVTRHLLRHHDALRLRYKWSETGWEQYVTDVDEQVPFEWVDLSEASPEARIQAVEEHAAALQASLNLLDGPVIRICYFDFGESISHRLLLIIHHLAIDGVSWRILLEDFQNAYWQALDGKEIKWPAKTSSLQHWAKRIQEYASAPALTQETDFWVSFLPQEITPMPQDMIDGPNSEASAQVVSVAITEEETQALLQEVPPVYNTQINDILLTALVKAFARWTSRQTLLVDMEGHGREDLFADVDVSRTVGWFTTLYPVHLDLRKTTTPAEEIMAIKEQMRRIPHNGIGFGLLRYLGEESERTLLAQMPRAEISFNYLGQFDQMVPKSAVFFMAKESKGAERSPGGERSYKLDVSGKILSGKLSLDWTFSKNIHQPATIEKLANDYLAELRALIAHCCSFEAGGYTASDFAEAELSQDQVEALLTELSEDSENE